MEAALLLFNALAVMVLVFTSLRNDRLRPDQPPTGPFRYVAGDKPRRPDRSTRTWQPRP